MSSTHNVPNQRDFSGQQVTDVQASGGPRMRPPHVQSGGPHMQIAPGGHHGQHLAASQAMADATIREDLVERHTSLFEDEAEYDVEQEVDPFGDGICSPLPLLDQEYDLPAFENYASLPLTTLRRMLSNIIRTKDARPFAVPVDWKELELEDYPEIVRHPMDLSTIVERCISIKGYASRHFLHDLKLVFANSLLYNPSDHWLIPVCRRISEFFFQKIRRAAATQRQKLAKRKRQEEGGDQSQASGASGTSSSSKKARRTSSGSSRRASTSSKRSHSRSVSPHTPRPGSQPHTQKTSKPSSSPAASSVGLLSGDFDADSGSGDTQGTPRSTAKPKKKPGRKKKQRSEGASSVSDQKSQELSTDVAGSFRKDVSFALPESPALAPSMSMESVGSTPTVAHTGDQPTPTPGSGPGRPRKKYKRKKVSAVIKPVIEEKDISFEDTFRSELPETESDVMLGIKIFGEPGVCGTVRVEEAEFGWSAKLSELRTLIQAKLPSVRLENSQHPFKKSTKWHFLRPNSYKPVGRNQEPHCQARDWLPYITILPEFAKEDLEEVLHKSLRPTRPTPLSNGVYPSNILLKSQCYSFPPAVRQQARTDLMKHLTTGLPVDVAHARAQDFDREVVRAQRVTGYTERLAMSIASGAGGSLSSSPRVGVVRAKKSALSRKRAGFMTPDFRSSPDFGAGSSGSASLASTKPKRSTALKKRKKAMKALAPPNLGTSGTPSKANAESSGSFATPMTAPIRMSTAGTPEVPASPLTLPASAHDQSESGSRQHVAAVNERSGATAAEIGAQGEATLASPSSAMDTSAS